MLQAMPNPPVLQLNRTDRVDQHKRVSRYPNVNWGKGRMLPFESQEAFVAKFCWLNRISIPECRSFFAKELQIRFGPGMLPLARDEQHVMRLARLLDEDSSTVRTLNALPFRMGFAFGSRSERNTFVVKDPFRYCTECMKNCYHSTLHGYWILCRCPIHSSPLVQIPLEHDFNSRVRILGKLFAEHKDSFGVPRKNPSHYCGLDETAYRSVSKVVKSIDRLSERSANQLIQGLGAGDYRMEDLGISLGRAANWVSIPKNVGDVFSKAIVSNQPRLREVPSEAVEEWRAICGEHDWISEIEMFFRVTSFLANEPTSFQRFARRAVVLLAGDPKAPPGKWSWMPGFGWGHVDRIVWEVPWSHPMTVREYAIEQLSIKWLGSSLRSETAQNFNKLWSEYVRVGNAMVEGGHARSLRSISWWETRTSAPAYELVIDPQVHCLVNLLLFEQCYSDFVDAARWIASIEAGQAPKEARKSRPCPSGLYMESGRAYLLRWKH